MGFFSSFKGQLGRDTGRLVSNKLFGNRHAIRHQSVTSQNIKATQNAQKAQREHELKMLKTQKHYELEMLEQEQENRNDEFEQQQLRENNLKLEREIANIISVKIPQKKEDLIEALNELSTMISANPWKDILETENRMSNNYSDVALKKYEQCLLSLKTKFPKEAEVIYYESQFKKFKRESIKGKFSMIFLISIVIIVLVILGINGVFDDKAEIEHRQGELINSIKSFFN